MKVTLVLCLAFAAGCNARSAGSSEALANPVQKVLELLSSLEAKVMKEGEAAQKAFDEFSDWCEDESKNSEFAIKTGKQQSEELKATIEKSGSTISALGGKIEELTASIGTDEADLKAATEIREKDFAEFSAEEADLVDSVDALGRAITILEREIQSGAASFVQLNAAGNLAKALTALVDAAAFSAKDASKLTALVQSSEDDGDGDMSRMMGAPDPKAYESHSGGIIEILQDLLDKANTELAECRKKEANSKHNFDMLKQSLDDEIAFANKEMSKAKTDSATAAETKAAAEGDLSATEKTLANDIEVLDNLHKDCMEKSTDFEAETQSRAEELKALAAAKKAIASSTAGAEGIAYSFLQIGEQSSQLKTGADLAHFEVVVFLRNLARKQQSKALALLASRVNSALRIGGASGDDPFQKVKGLIGEMIERLLKEAQEDANQKGYCDKEMGQTKQKKAELDAEIEKLSTKIDKMSAQSATLKDEVATLQKELAELAASQAEMDKIRQDEHSLFVSNKADLEEGLEGVQVALKILREYYGGDKAHSSADGAASGIIGMIEVVESDFSKGLAEATDNENSAEAEYTKISNENEITKTMKEQDVTYKTKESKTLDTSIAEATSDREGAQGELDAVLQYFDKLKPMCIAKPESYEERVKRREAEIASLKEALQILGGEAVFLQKRIMLRGLHHVAPHRH